MEKNRKTSARMRLMRRRFRRRPHRTFGIAVLCGVILFLFDWAGYQGKFLPLGDARSLGKIWWHLPALIGFFSIVMMLWPWRLDRYDSI